MSFLHKTGLRSSYSSVQSPKMDVYSQELPLPSTSAHEMYHRMTAGRKGLAGEMWVQEMMASLSSHWFLRRRKVLQEYADAREGRLAGLGRDARRPTLAQCYAPTSARSGLHWDLLLRKVRALLRLTALSTSVGRRTGLCFNQPSLRCRTIFDALSRLRDWKDGLLRSHKKSNTASVSVLEVEE